MNCIILEDDREDLKTVSDYVNKCPELKLEGACYNTREAEKILSEKTIDLLLLDIELSGGRNGLEFYNNLEVKPCAIAMTAHPKYAINSYKIHINGFLHKPFGFNEFKEAVDYAIDTIRKQKKLEALHQIEYNTGSYIPILDGRKEIILFYSDIAYFDSKGKTVLVYDTSNIEYNLGRRSINQLENELPYQLFQRINRKQIINKSNAQRIFGNVVRINNKILKASSGKL